MFDPCSYTVCSANKVLPKAKGIALPSFDCGRFGDGRITFIPKSRHFQSKAFQKGRNGLTQMTGDLYSILLRTVYIRNLCLVYTPIL